jgi:hypothetical protein
MSVRWADEPNSVRLKYLILKKRWSGPFFLRIYHYLCKLFKKHS